ncbi:mannose-1-phosphate guanylyltransferase/mannose-6-phosphate isomerase [Microbulbifer bruguierae]|uniref:mannose-1-phosphate guanylyltransferase n=1 Tax=Microbulbifer bruguierae TaxID=3029061 RepID=A0ABY8NBU3_9GAMM|nr:mannose-1-phosphate guanylyltransferase/mannose-6-phosphate isomerase [Microbulbifer bruguierae]WGL16395.1 mannose-1-phosphate guanylyltransferase/mannose-6-phosphate isomerase [Microbulbifer bruguierae]
MIYPTILAGGSGTRLWPLSRKMFPKQFLSFSSERTMLQETLTRLDGLDAAEVMMICSEEHRFIAAEQLRQMGHLDHNIILEPIGKNTAPAIAVAAMKAMQSNSDAVLLVMAADHVIDDCSEFHRAISAAEALANDGYLVTFGVVPTAPETGYGYIRRGDSLSIDAFRVADFVEKPDLETAECYLEGGEHYWNSGMFMFKASRYLEELREYSPEIYSACDAAFQNINEDLDFVRIGADEFSRCPSDSIDYAVMEKTNSAVVVPMSAGWSDVGSWSALWEIGEKDSFGNVVSGDVILEQSSDTYVYSESQLVATLGVNDLVIVQTKDAILVADKGKVQDVKHLVARIKDGGRNEHNLHREVYRPWGKYDSVDSGDRYQVKRITVKPGEKLSVQMHHHRAEHWIVVAGTAKVTIEGVSKLVSENESVYIPIGHVHSLENPGKIPLDLIEVQSGSYLGEDDIVRMEDRYGRA